MAQRIQAPLNAGLCLIISREGLSVVPPKKRQAECDSERQKNRAEGGLKARRKASTRSSRSYENGGEKRERRVPVATLFLSCDGF